MKVSVQRMDGSNVRGKVELDPAVFEVEPNDHAIWLDVKSIQANARQGTHKAKERSDVRGGGAKPWRQKGTGRARVGTTRSPLWVGGGTIFGPRPRNYNVRVNRKTKHVASRSALTYKAREEAVRIVADLSLEEPKTKAVSDMLAAMELSGSKVLIVTGAPDSNIYKSARNITGVAIQPAGSVSTLDIMKAHVLLVQKEALDVLSSRFGGGSSEATAAAAEETETEVAE